MRWVLVAGALLLIILVVVVLRPFGDGGPTEAVERGQRGAGPDDAITADDASQAASLVGREGVEEESDAPAATYALWVLVEDAADGHRIEGARVEATLADGSTVRGTTLPNGLVRIQGLRAVPARVVASAEGYVTDLPEWSNRFDAPVARVVMQLWPATGKPVRVLELETGRPVAGARLVLHPCLMVRVNRSPFTLEGALEAGTTDGHGDALLQVRAGKSHYRGRVLAIHAEGRRTTWWPMIGSAAAGPDPWVLRIPPGGALTGTVRDGQGRPLAGVAVTACPGTRGWADTDDVADAWPLNDLSGTFGRGSRVGTVGGWWSPLRAVTGSDGRFRIPGVGLGQPYRVAARKAGYTPADAAALRADRDAGGIRWDPVLRAGGRLVVRVVDPDGKPIPGVYGSASGASPRRSLGGGRTDDEGVLAFEGLDTGTYDVGLQPKAGPDTPKNQFGQAEYEHEKGWGLTVRRGETTEVVLVLPHGAHGNPPDEATGEAKPVRVAGIVVDEDGRGLEGVVLCDRVGVPLAVTDAQGRFVASMDSRDGLTLGVNGPYATDEVFAPPEDGSELRIVARPRQLVPVRLRIVLPEGAPAPASLRVTLSPRWRGGVGYSQPAPSGTFEVAWPAPDAREVLVERDVPPGGVWVRIEAEGFLLSRREIQAEVGIGPVGEVFALDRGRVARGRVVDEAGKPVGGARVEVSGDTEDGNSRISGRGLTSSDGSFAVGGLGEPPWVYEVEAEGYLPIESPWFRFIDEPRVPNVDPDHVVLRRGGRLRVVVVDGDGFPRAEISIAMDRKGPEAREDDAPWSATDHAYGATELDGSATFLLAPGTWEVTLPSGWQDVPDLAAPQRAEVQAGEMAEVRFVLAGE